MRISSLLLILAAVALGAPAEADLPAGSVVQVRLMDYVNTEHQPLGFTYRGTVEGSVIVQGKVVIPDQARVLLRLVAEPNHPEGLTLELWAVKFGSEWSEFRKSDSTAPLFTTLKSAVDNRAPSLDSHKLESQGARLFLPFKTLLKFEMATPLTLLPVGSFRF